jgi:hypothetical protein
MDGRCRGNPRGMIDALPDGKASKEMMHKHHFFKALGV